MGHEQAESAAEESQEDAFGEQLADEPGAASSEGGANGDFFLTDSRASEQEVGDIGAGNQHDEADGAEEGPKGARGITDDVFEEGIDPDADLGVGIGVLLLEPHGNRVHLSAGLFEGYPW